MTSPATVVVKKRERTQNWVPEEKNALFSLIKIHVGAIENKKIDAAASAMKTLAWQEIYSRFRGRFSTERDITRMREQWRRMKAQARIEMYTFAEKVRTLGPEEASKNRPSNLSIEVWRLMENSRKRNGEANVSDESSQDAETGTGNFQTILDKLTVASPPEVSIHEVKLEKSIDGYNAENHPVEPCGNFREQLSSQLQKRDGEQETRTTNQKKTKVDETFLRYLERDESVDSNNSVPELRAADQPEAMRNTIWIFEAAQKEHDLKLRMLNIELERADLQKQTALNDLKTSELKKQLIQSQATEFYSQVRMSGEPGSGAGQGGGGGGSIRAAGGAFGKMEAAREDQYFYNQQKDQLTQLRESLHDEISFHEEQIKRHEEAIARHKNRIGKMEQK